jgi:hypothetical protein
MQQKWWLILAGIVGIGLAILLFPRPDTGETIPEADLTNADPLNFKEPGQGAKPDVKTAARSKVVKRRDLRPPQLGARPLASLASRRQAPPEAVFAGRASGPWTIIRRQLILTKTDQGQSVADEIAPLVTDLRSIRRDPMSLDWDAIVVRQKELTERVRANGEWMADETTRKSVERLDTIFEEIAAHEGD